MSTNRCQARRCKCGRPIDPPTIEEALPTLERASEQIAQALDDGLAVKTGFGYEAIKAIVMNAVRVAAGNDTKSS